MSDDIKTTQKTDLAGRNIIPETVQLTDCVLLNSQTHTHQENYVNRDTDTHSFSGKYHLQMGFMVAKVMVELTNRMV